MNRIDSFFHATPRRKAFVAYITAGDPCPATTPDLVFAIEQAGADIIELGVPFSDPLADGSVNQLAAQRALQAGTTTNDLFKIVETIRKRSEIPLVLFSYYNPIFRFGLEPFMRRSEEAGVDGLLVLDLPPEEAARDWPANSGLKRISLIAPTTPAERMKTICSGSSGFIYYVSREGVTGMQSSVAVGLEGQVSALKGITSLPICVGFGISGSEQAAQVARVADGVVVGSAIVDRVREWGAEADLCRRVHDFVKPLADATHTP